MKFLYVLWMACGLSQALAQVGEKVVLHDLGGLQIDKTEVTIGQFKAYAQATSIKTRAEQEGGGFEFVGGVAKAAGLDVAKTGWG